MPTIEERIKFFNSNRLPEYTAIKYRKMAMDPFVFFRGTAHLFYEDLSGTHVIPRYPLTWVCGDLHIENFGSYKGDNRLVYFDMNDFDEATLAPATWELARMITSIFIALKTMGVTRKNALQLVWLFFKTYSTTLAKGRSRYIEPQTAAGIVKTFLTKVCERKQKDLINARTTKKDGKLALTIDNKLLFKIDKNLKSELVTFLNGWLVNGGARRRYRAKDASFRVAGTGSIGVKRYIFLTERVDVPGKHLLIDMKQAMPSALESYAQVQQPAWTSQAERVVAVQERMQNISPALLGAALFKGDPFVIKEMQPTADKIDFATIKNRFQDIEEVIKDMALITASAQLRSSGRQGSAIADDLITFGQDTTWMQPIITYAEQYAQQVVKDYKAYLKAYKAGFFRISNVE